MKLDITGLQKQANTLYSEAQGLLAPYKGKETEIPTEVMTQVEAKIGKADEYRAQIKTFNSLNGTNLDQLDDSEDLPESALSWRKAVGNEGDTEVDPQSWQEVETAYGRKVRYNVPLSVTKAGKNYAKSYEAYLRYGKNVLASKYPRDMKSLTESVDNSGGYFVPSEFIAQIIKRTSTQAKVRSLANVMTTGRDLVTMPRLNYSTDNKYTSGVRFTWTGEIPASATTARVTDQISGEINIPIHTAMASQLLSVNMLEDSAFDVWGLSAELFGEAFDLGEDEVFLTGNGVNKPMGILGQTGITAETPTIVVSGTSAVFTTSGDAHEGVRLNNVYYDLPAQYRSNAVWMLNSASMLALENLVDGQDRPILNSLTNASMALGEPSTIKGKPLIVDEFLADPAASSFSLLFGDFKSYAIFDRVGLSIKRLDELYAETNYVLMLARKRLGAYLLKPFAMRVMKLST